MGRNLSIIASQLPFEIGWYHYLSDPTIADAILDRLVVNSHKIILRGNSLKTSKSKKDM